MRVCACVHACVCTCVCVYVRVRACERSCRLAGPAALGWCTPAFAVLCFLFSLKLPTQHLSVRLRVLCRVAPGGWAHLSLLSGNRVSLSLDHSSAVTSEAAWSLTSPGDTWRSKGKHAGRPLPGSPVTFISSPPRGVGRHPRDVSPVGRVHGKWCSEFAFCKQHDIRCWPQLAGPGAPTSPSLSLQHLPAPCRGEADPMSQRPPAFRGVRNMPTGQRCQLRLIAPAVPVLAPNMRQWMKGTPGTGLSLGEAMAARVLRRSQH